MIFDLFIVGMVTLLAVVWCVLFFYAFAMLGDK